MTTSHMTKIFALALTLALGIPGGAFAASDSSYPLASILTDIEGHIAELTLNIDQVSDRIKFLRGAPPSKDPLIQEILDLDIRGWELHKEQWNYQLENLRFTEEILRKVQEHPEGKPEALKAWHTRLRKFHEAMEQYRQQRAGVEVLRLETAAQLIEQYLR